MCRFTLYVGPPVRLASVITEPAHSLIHQSYDARERKEPLNGDGFGVAWYAPRISNEPAIFRSFTPAWNDPNLRSIARLVTSPCIVAHVRAATEGSAVNLANTHPFAYGRYLLAHNGHVGGIRRVRRPLLESLSDEAFSIVQGSTDSELLFATLVDDVIETDADAPFTPPSDGGVAMDLALSLTTALARVLEVVRERAGGAPSFLNVAATNGLHAAVTRFTDHPENPPDTLYVLHGEHYPPAGRDFEPRRRMDDVGEPVLISSERLTDDGRWQAVPTNHIVVVDRWTPPKMLPMRADGRIESELAAPVRPG